MFRSLALGAACALVAGCAALPGAAPQASADLAPTRGNTARGSVKFSRAGDRVVVEARVEGLPAGSVHGFHVHEKGDCSAPDATSAGGHFNPHGKPHGPHASPDHHAGDMPNLQAGADGVALLRAELTGLSIGSGRADDIVGRGVIVHASPDDYKTQPTGNSGARLACGVIRRP